MNQSFPETTAYEGSKAPANDARYEYITDPKIARLFAATGSMDSFAPSNERVVVVVPSGNYNEPRELGRYKNIQIAFQIIKSLDLTEYRIFSLESGNELFAH